MLHYMYNVQRSSVNEGIMRSENPICASPRLSEVSPTLLLKLSVKRFKTYLLRKEYTTADMGTPVPVHAVSETSRCLNHSVRIHSTSIVK